VALLRSDANKLLGAIKQTPQVEFDSRVDLEGQRLSRNSYLSSLPLDVLRSMVNPL